MSEVSNWPPIPIHAAENEVSAVVVTVGIVQEAVTPVMVGWGFCGSEATT